MSTWGQLRLLLQKDGPGIDPDLLDGYLNTRYADVLDRYPWKGLEVETTFETTAAYQTGTVNVTQGSDAIAGVGTTWTPAMSGMKFVALATDAVYIFTYVSATSATLDRNYEDASNTAAPYWIFQDEYVLPAATKNVISLQSPVTGRPLDDCTKGQLLRPVFRPGFPGTPEAFAMAADTNEDAPPVYHTLQFYPPPLTARGYPMRYTKATAGFDGVTTTGSPLPFVSDNAILCGCRADIKHKLKDPTGAETQEMKYEKAIQVMMKADILRRGVAVPITAPRFSSYRIRRVLR